MKCVHFFIEYYGAAPVEIIYELYKLKMEESIDEMIDMPYEYAASWCLQAWANSYEGESIGDILDKMSEANVIFENEKQTNEILGLLVTPIIIRV